MLSCPNSMFTLQNPRILSKAVGEKRNFDLFILRAFCRANLGANGSDRSVGIRVVHCNIQIVRLDRMLVPIGRFYSWSYGGRGIGEIQRAEQDVCMSGIGLVSEPIIGVGDHSIQDSELLFTLASMAKPTTQFHFKAHLQLFSIPCKIFVEAHGSEIVAMDHN